ncbi:MAG: pyrroline-5-carboxylate reductase [Erysipelotrichaceae bacterium]|nr:pyrroline-5-carboxylate reductase [Erysipelotrichaceae bacterium]
MKLGFLGYGNMAQAIAKGLVNAKVVNPEDIYASAFHYDKLVKNCGILGIHACKSNEELINSCDWVVLAIKPYQVESVLPNLYELLKDKVILSIIAGWDFDKLEEVLPHTKHILINPNTPIEVGEGIILLEDKHTLTDEEFSEVKKMFEPIALVEVLSSELMNIGGKFSGCTPAYIAMFLEALGDVGVKYGLKRDAAYRLGAQVIKGTGALYLNSGTHPGAMKDAVCSPSGSTIKGVEALEQSGFRGSVMGAIDATMGKK